MTPLNQSSFIDAMERHIAQRSGIDYRNYGDRASLMADYSKILKHGRDARAMLKAVRVRTFTDAEIADALRAYSGRLRWVDGRLEYCTGQYFPTEYRAAACAVLASLLWNYWRESGTTAQTIRKTAAKELGRGIAGRWFH